MSIFKLYARAVKEKEAILKSLKPLRAEEALLIDEHDRTRAKLQAVRDKIVAVEEPRLRLAGMVIAARHNPKPSAESEERYEAALDAYERLEPLEEA
jgi:hypothetical protein